MNGRMAFVPEGQHDRSQARSAWESATQKLPPDQTVPYGTVLSVDAFPGTSCLATIMLSLWDEIHSPLAVAGRAGIKRARATIEQGIVDCSKAAPANKNPSLFPPRRGQGQGHQRPGPVAKTIGQKTAGDFADSCRTIGDAMSKSENQRKPKGGRKIKSFHLLKG
jgi:hypothetical protein